MSKKDKLLVLVGFGPHSLEEMMSWIGTEKEEDLLFAPDKWIPRFRIESSCSEQEIKIFLEYVDWTTKIVENVLKEKK